ncbi:MAG TPA: hypothetical protein VFU14_20165 [Acidimicrobiales bacterium]|nr:hypothetical protein [Acidimicrobiales bacterium]
MADPYDLLSPTEGSQAVGPNTAAADGRIARLVTAVSRRIDRLCGPVVEREVTEAHDGGLPSIVLEVGPVASITSVTEWAGGVGTVLTAETLEVFPSAGYLASDLATHRPRLVRRASGGTRPFRPGAGNVVVVYQAGRFADTDAVDSDWKQAAAEIVAQQWKQTAGAWARSPALGEFDEDLPGYLSIDDMIRRRLRDQLIPTGFA